MHATYGRRIALAMGLSIVVAAIGPAVALAPLFETMLAPRLATVVAAGLALPAAAQLSGPGSELFVENELGIYGPMANDEFGTTLATGDFDGNGFADLAIGAPRESTAFTGDGAEWVIYGTWPGLPFADGFETGHEPLAGHVHVRRHLLLRVRDVSPRSPSQRG